MQYLIINHSVLFKYIIDSIYTILMLKNMEFVKNIFRGKVSISINIPYYTFTWNTYLKRTHARKGNS